MSAKISRALTLRFNWSIALDLIPFLHNNTSCLPTTAVLLLVVSFKEKEEPPPTSLLETCLKLRGKDKFKICHCLCLPQHTQNYQLLITEQFLLHWLQKPTPCSKHSESVETYWVLPFITTTRWNTHQEISIYLDTIVTNTEKNNSQQCRWDNEYDHPPTTSK